MDNMRSLKCTLNGCIEKNILRLCTVLFFITFSAFSSVSSQTEVFLSFKEAKLGKVIDYIENTTKYRFLYQNSELDLNKKVSINYRGKLSTALTMLFRDTPVKPLVVNNQIILKKREVKALQVTISGVVSDKDGLPLSGVDVVVNKIERFTTTDEDGKYKILAKKGDKLSFMLLGFKDLDLTVGDKTVMNVALEEDVNMIDEVVLIGFGEQKKENVSTAISSVKADVVTTNLQTGATFDRGLDGLMKGVFVTQGTGELGRNADIIIRGVTSPFGGSTNNPLFIIDGVPLRTPSQFNRASGEQLNPLQAINPEDIESINVLKDAAATAIYGSRGANGVIIVKTKSGLYDQPTTVTLSAKTTFGKPVNTLNYLNAADFKKHILALNKNSYDHYKSGVDPEYGLTLSQKIAFGFSEDPVTGEIVYDPSKIRFGNADTNWNDVVYRSAAVTNQFNANISGGGEKSFYALSLGYTDQEGILRADQRKQYNVRLSTNFDIFDNLKTGASINYVFSDQETGFNNTTLNSISYLGTQLRFRPDLPVYDENGNFTYTVTGETNPTKIANPLAVTTLNSQKRLLNHYILGNLFAEYNITDDLMFKTDLSYSTSFSDLDDYKPKEYSIDGYDKNSKSELLLSNTRSTNSVTSFTLNYNKTFNNHNITGLLGYSHTRDIYDINSSNHRDFVSTFRDPQYAKELVYSNKESQPSGINSFFARASYNYKEKYGFSSVVRWDRSSVYHPKNRSKFFPSASAYWNIHREDFMNDSFFDELRLRVSAGQTGSSAFDKFSYLQLFQVQGVTTYNGEPAAAFDRSFANKNLTWEITTEYNLGLNFRQKRNFLRGSVDVYHKTSRDVVSGDRTPSSTGADLFSKNNATILNKGFELSLGSTFINTEELTWSVDANASKNINKLVAVSDVAVSGDNSTYYAIGSEVNIIRGYQVRGIITEQSRIDELNAQAQAKGHSFYDQQGTGVGDYEYVDVNGDGRITAADGMAIIGSRQPDLFGGFNTRLRYKGISLGAYFSYAFGLESVRSDGFYNGSKLLNVESHLRAENRWSPTNTSATLPRLIHTGEFESRVSNLNIFDSSYLRLTTLKLGYDLPTDKISKLGFSSLNVYVVGTNLATWTDFPGLDPQGALGGAASGENTANGDAYPSAKTFSLGVNIKF